MSLTYRTLKKENGCTCVFKHLCDFQNKDALQLPTRTVKFVPPAKGKETKHLFFGGLPAIKFDALFEEHRIDVVKGE